MQVQILIFIFIRSDGKLLDSDVDGRILLKWIFRKWDVGVWSGSIWLSIGISGGVL
jgi:hypothetical protein